MTAWDAVRWVDEKKHNVYSLEDKLKWLSQLEAMDCRLRCRLGGTVSPRELTPESVLTIPEPYDQLYLRWLEAQIDYTAQEYGSYNNAMATFSALWQDYANDAARRASLRGQWRFF